MDGPWKIYFETKGEPYLEFIQELSKDIKKCIWYFHPDGKQGKGPHIHALVYDYPRTDETMRNYIKKKFNLDGTKQEFAVSNKYERGTVMTEQFTPKYISYMTKGKFDPILMKGYQDAEIQSFKEAWIEPKVQVLNIEVVKTIKPKITRYALAQNVLASYIDNDIENWGPDDNKELIKRCVDICNANRVLPHYRCVAEIAQAVKLNLDPARASAYRKCLNMV